jgi:predicted nucleotide-binding protein
VAFAVVLATPDDEATPPDDEGVRATSSHRNLTCGG